MSGVHLKRLPEERDTMIRQAGKSAQLQRARMRHVSRLYELTTRQCGSALEFCRLHSQVFIWKTVKINSLWIWGRFTFPTLVTDPYSTQNLKGENKPKDLIWILASKTKIISVPHNWDWHRTELLNSSKKTELRVFTVKHKIILPTLQHSWNRPLAA